MSSSEQRAQGSDHPASSSEARHDTQAKQQGSESVSSAGEHMNQKADSTVEKVTSQAPQPPERPERPQPAADSSSVGNHQNQPSETNISETPTSSELDQSQETDAFRQLPIPPASEPMQYRAIGLIRGKYEPSEEQFTRGNLVTDDGTEVDAVLLGRVMSLVKKHIELDEPHLWVVYPRTRNKDSQLHAQIVGVWEPEKLNRDDDDLDETADTEPAETSAAEAAVEQIEDSKTIQDSKSSEEASAGASEALAEPTGSNAKTIASNTSEEAIATETTESPEETVDQTEPKEAIAPSDSDESVAADSSATEATDAEAPAAESTDPSATTGGESVDSEDSGLLPAPKPPKAPAAPSAAPAPTTKSDGSQEMLHDGYFSIRGEIVKCSPEEQQLTVKIRQAPRKAGSQPKAFNLVLLGTIEGRTTGYFWELDVQREGNNLVVQDGSMIRMVPPSKTKRKGGKPFRDNKRRGGGGPRTNNYRPSRPPNRSTPKPNIKKKSAQSKAEEAPSSENQG